MELLCISFVKILQRDSSKNKGHLCLWREDSLKEKYNTNTSKLFFI